MWGVGLSVISTSPVAIPVGQLTQLVLMVVFELTGDTSPVAAGLCLANGSRRYTQARIHLCTRRMDLRYGTSPTASCASRWARWIHRCGSIGPRTRYKRGGRFHLL